MFLNLCAKCFEFLTTQLITVYKELYNSEMFCISLVGAAVLINNIHDVDVILHIISCTLSVLMVLMIINFGSGTVSYVLIMHLYVFCTGLEQHSCYKYFTLVMYNLFIEKCKTLWILLCTLVSITNSCFNL
jgi:hypothetical protein